MTQLYSLDLPEPVEQARVLRPPARTRRNRRNDAPRGGSRHDAIGPTGGLGMDRLPLERPVLEVKITEDRSFGAAAGGPREPHRHDYHELCWTRRGSGSHLIDGRRYPVGPSTLTLVGRGQVHLLERARIAGAVVRFSEEALADDSSAGPDPGWLLDTSGSRTVSVPAPDVPRLEAILEALADETRRPHDYRSPDAQSFLLSTLLLWVERWCRPMLAERRPMDADHRLYGRFLTVLDRDFASHHETGHYARALATPAVTLSRALARVCGRTTKELITERVMLEAARLLRFSDLTIGEVASRTGFGDQFYFSRAFKRRYGDSPLAYRARLCEFTAGRYADLQEVVAEVHG